MSQSRVIHEEHSDIRTLSEGDIPQCLREISDPPRALNYRGVLPIADRIMLAVVGARKHTAYGKEVAVSLIRGLRGYPITIVSGLALGIDGIAHRTALEVGLPTLAIPGSGLSKEVLYPPSHRKLAEEILDAGGGLLSEFSPETPAAPWTFPKRNRIMAGLSQAVLIIEAAEQSGTLITARLAMECWRDVLAVPGQITSLLSRGPNALIRDGAIPILSPVDILDALGVPQQSAREVGEHVLTSLSEKERSAYLLLTEPVSRDTLFSTLGITPEEGNILVLELEMKGLIRTYGGSIMRADQ